MSYFTRLSPSSSLYCSMLVSAVIKSFFIFWEIEELFWVFKLIEKTLIFTMMAVMSPDPSTPPDVTDPTCHHVQSLSIWRREWDSTITHLSPEIAFCTSNLWRFVSGADFIEMSSVVQSRLTMTQDLKHTCSHSSSTSPIWTLYPDCARSYCSLHALVKWLTPVNSFILFPFGLMPPHIH